MSSVDLHVHSTKSDGTLTPSQLVDYAREKNLKAFALTDHDTIDGLQEAMEYAGKLRRREAAEGAGSRFPVPEVIPGIEFSTEYHHRDIHIVGLFINHKTPAFAEHLQKFIDSRTARNQKMCALLQEAGFDITYDKLLSTFPGAVITRAHYAKYLLQHGYISSLKEAFDRYIGDRCPYFVPRKKVTPEQAIRLILEADGVPVLAHPILYHMSDARLEALVADLKKAGLMGIEGLYSTYSSADERQVSYLARKYRLLISGGSDFHGSNKPGLDLGCGYGKLTIPNLVMNEIKRSLKNILFTDIDGTLLRDDSTISEPMKKALLDLIDAGHRLILTSGRPLPSILELCEETGILSPNMIIIANNGALIYSHEDGRVLQEHCLTGEDAAYVIGQAQKAGIHIHGYTKSQIVALEMNEELRFYTRRIHMPIKYVKDLSDALSEGTYKLQAIHLTDHDALMRFRDSLLPYCGSRIRMLFSNDSYLEILPAEAGKDQALQFVTNYLPLPHSHTFAAGDAENDIPMLKAAHFGIAMQNAKDKVKENADYVTHKDNNHDGLLEILKQYFI